MVCRYICCMGSFHMACAIEIGSSAKAKTATESEDLRRWLLVPDQVAEYLPVCIHSNCFRS